MSVDRKPTAAPRKAPTPKVMVSFCLKSGLKKLFGALPKEYLNFETQEEFYEYAIQMKWLEKENLDRSIDVFLEKIFHDLSGLEVLSHWTLFPGNHGGLLFDLQMQQEVTDLEQDYDIACPCIANQSSYKSSSESDEEKDQASAAPVPKRKSRRSVCLRRLSYSSSSSDDGEGSTKEQAGSISEKSDDDDEDEGTSEPPEQSVAKNEVNNISSEDDDNFDAFINKLNSTKKSTNVIVSSNEEEDYGTDEFIDDSIAETRPHSLCKAFDCIPHDLLIAKLHAYGFDEDAFSNTSIDNSSKILGRDNEQWFTPRENTVFWSSDDDDAMQKSETSTSRRKKKQTSSKKILQTPVFKTPAVRKSKTDTPFKTPASTRHSHCTPKILDQITTPKTPSSSAAYKRQYKKLRDQTANELFELFNETVFENKLPKDTKLVFNKRMTKTAGFCYYYRNSATKVRTAKVELAEKVCDTVERLRDTIIHELCHAAAWILNGVKCGHGTHWKLWADRAHKAHPDLPPISRCHQFDIECKFNYKCLNPYCARTYGRHSKSLKKCPDCFGSLQLLEKDGITPAKQRTPNKFALFVKEQYRAEKAENPEMVHADIMKSLGQKFSALST